ncbi:MAG: hypothetical protein AB1664_21350 [Thermodesulfobacteriota bacterium]
MSATTTRAPKSGQRIPASLEEAMARIDASGVACPLSLLEAELEALPLAIRRRPEAQWLEGFFYGRVLHERLGGVA